MSIFTDLRTRATVTCPASTGRPAGSTRSRSTSGSTHASTGCGRSARCAPGRRSTAIGLVVVGATHPSYRSSEMWTTSAGRCARWLTSTAVRCRYRIRVRAKVPIRVPGLPNHAPGEAGGLQTVGYIRATYRRQRSRKRRGYATSGLTRSHLRNRRSQVRILSGALLGRSTLPANRSETLDRADHRVSRGLPIFPGPRLTRPIAQLSRGIQPRKPGLAWA